jgi:hypothetical protein
MKRVGALRLLTFAAALSAACGSKLDGSYVGQAQLHIKSYETGSFAASDESADNVAATLTTKSASEFYLSFDDKGPLRCKLLVANKNLEDNDTGNDKELEVRLPGAVQKCEVKDKSGMTQTAKVLDMVGGAGDQSSNFLISLEAEGGSGTRYDFSYRGSRP